MLSVLDAVWPYLVAIIVFILMIVIHEFGHFLLAKLSGIKVNEFAVGFGPTLLSTKKGETEYKINAIPLGGYCAMEGEDEGSDDKRAFCNAKAYKRFLVVIAGAVFNLILGFVLIGSLLINEDLYSSTKVAKFTDNAVSCTYGLKAGDIITEVNGRRVFTTADLAYTFTNVKGNSVDMVVKRGKKSVKLNDVTFKTEKYDGINYLTCDFYVKGVKPNFLTFFTQTFKTTVSYGRTVWFSLVDLITGKYGISALSGPVGLTKVIGESARLGIRNLISVLALVTVNLGIFNLLPLPALDGGRLLFILAEMIIGRPVPKKFEGYVHAVGFALLIGMMILVTAKDIVTLFVK